MTTLALILITIIVALVDEYNTNKAKRKNTITSQQRINQFNKVMKQLK